MARTYDWQKRAGLSRPELCLIMVESLQWMAHNAVYFLGLIGAASYDLGGSAFLVAGITLVHNLTTSLGNVTSADAALIAEQMTTTAEPETTTAITLSPPVISPSSGSYSENTQIMVSSPEGADIFYTYDGTVPGPRSNLYTGPVMMTPGTQTFSAICIKDGVESLVSSCTFTLEYDYPYSAQEAMDLVTNELIWDGYTMDYDLHTYDGGYAKLTHQGVYEIDGYTYYIIKVDIYSSTDTLDSTDYRGVGVNFGNVYFAGEENGSYYIRW